MKRLAVLAFSLVLIVSLSSCLKPQQIQEKNHNKTVSSTSLNIISEQDAVKIIKSIIGTNKGKRIIEFDRIEKLNNRNYLVIHAYSLGEGMNFTYGWYYVDRISGKPYNLKVDGLTLVPMKKLKN